MSRSPLLLIGLLVGVVCLAAPAARAQTPRELFFPVPEADAPRIALDTPVLRTRTVAFDASALEAPIERLRIELFERHAPTFLLERRDVRDAGELTWSGKLEGEPASTASFALSDGALCGSIRIRDRLWRVRSRPDGLATLEEIDESRVPPCGTTERQRVVLPNAPLPPAPQAIAPSPTIDVMVVYTPAARIGQGGTAQMNALIDLAVLESNQAYANSQVLQRMRLVHRGELVGYAAQSWPTDMSRIHNPADGWLDYVHTWRAQCGADVIVLLEDDNGPNCGVAFLMATLTTTFAPDAFAIVSRTCATGFYTFGHELGHVMGLAHDRDNSTDKIMRASYSSSLLASNAASYSPAVSRFGRYVAFLSDGTNLVANDNNGFADVFLRDRQGYTTVRVNVGPGGAQANGFLLSAPAVSQSGALVAFDCTASNLVANDTNGVGDVFVRDVAAGVTERVSVATSGAQADAQSYDTAMSADGRFVAFASDASNLSAGIGGTQVYLRDRQAGTTVLVSANLLGGASNGVSRRPSVSHDGRYVSFTSVATDLVAGDTNAKADVFVRDVLLGVTLRASVRTGGLQANGDSPFTSAISGDGNFVAFASFASDLVAGDTNGTWDVFVFDRVALTTVRASVGPGGVQGNGPSGWMARPSITEDGASVAFASRASNLIAGDTNGSDDVFVRDMTASTTTRVSVTASGHGIGGHSGQVDQNTTVAVAAGNGDAVVFVSAAPLEVIDFNGQQDAYVFQVSQPDPPGLDEYSYGYRTHDGLYRTIMSYPPGIRVPFFSNPAATWFGHILGVAHPDPYSAEAFRTLNNSGSTVAAFFPTVFSTVCNADGTGTPCPCGNDSAPDSGCLNSLGNSGRLSAFGTAGISNDTVEMRAVGMPDSFALWFQGTQAVGGGAGAVFGDGLRCAGGNVWRLATKAIAGGATRLPETGEPRISALGLLTGPGQIVYQVWYRNPAAFCTPSTFNLTNGLSITWMP